MHKNFKASKKRNHQPYHNDTKYIGVFTVHNYDHIYDSRLSQHWPWQNTFELELNCVIASTQYNRQIRDTEKMRVNKSENMKEGEHG